MLAQWPLQRLGIRLGDQGSIPTCRVKKSRGRRPLPWRWRGVAVLLLLPGFLAAESPLPSASVSGLRCVVLESEDIDAATWRSIAALGANLLARVAPPSPEADWAAGEAGLSYLAFLTTEAVESLGSDPVRVAEIRAEKNLVGFFYWDAGVQEGFPAPDAQRRTYMTLKSLFPEKIVLYPTRLDPIVWSPGFLDAYFRPEFTDWVTPYFYPVGTTVLGQARESDNWQERLAALLGELAARVPQGKKVLPVLQGYEQQGYPVGSRFPAAQFEVYQRFWPQLRDAAIEGWEFGPGPLVALASRPALQQGVCSLFARLSDAPEHCRWRPIVPWR
jgi:hypothetical protein